MPSDGNAVGHEGPKGHNSRVRATTTPIENTTLRFVPGTRACPQDGCLLARSVRLLQSLPPSLRTSSSSQVCTSKDACGFLACGVPWMSRNRQQYLRVGTASADSSKHPVIFQRDEFQPMQRTNARCQTLRHAEPQLPPRLGTELSPLQSRSETIATRVLLSLSNRLRGLNLGPFASPTTPRHQDAEWEVLRESVTRFRTNEDGPLLGGTIMKRGRRRRFSFTLVSFLPLI